MTDTQELPAGRERRRPGLVLFALVALFPVGLALLVRSPWPRRLWKVPLAAAALVVFLAELHVVFGMRVVLLGDMTPTLDFFVVPRHERTLERHRRSQEHTPAPSLPAVTAPDLDRDWPGFRGGRRDGVVRSGPLGLPWPEAGPKLLWAQPIGGGHGSFAIAAGRAFTIEQRGGDEVVTCYALETGRELWAHRYSAHFQEPLGGPGPRTTPTVADGRVFSLGATGVLTCLEANTGQHEWSRNILADADADNLDWAVSASPWVEAGRVYVVAGGPGASVIAYDIDSGEPVLRGGSHKAGYASPITAGLLGTRHLLVFDAAGLTAYAPDDLALRWHFPWKTSHGVNAAQPIVVDDAHVLIGSGYGHGSALIELTKTDDSFEARQVWSSNRLKLKFTSAVLKDGAVYGFDEKILTCLDVATGKPHWKGGRYGYGQLVLADDFLIIQCEDGDLALVQATTDAYREVSRVRALDHKTWNHPALADGKLLIRNDRKMMCFDLSPSE